MQMNDKQRHKLKLALQREANNYTHFQHLYFKMDKFISEELYDPKSKELRIHNSKSRKRKFSIMTILEMIRL